MSGSSTWSRSSPKEGVRSGVGLWSSAWHWFVCLLESHTTVLAQVYLLASKTIEPVCACLLVPVFVSLLTAIDHGLVCLLASRMFALAFLMTQHLPPQSLFRWSTLSRAWGLPVHPAVCLLACCLDSRAVVELSLPRCSRQWLWPPRHLQQRQFSPP